MSNERVGFISGTFNPITWGHLSLMEQSLNLVDRLIVCVADNPAKQILMTQEERVALAQEAIKDHFASTCSPPPDIQVVCNDPGNNQYTVDLANELNANIIIRGARTAADFIYEQDLAQANLELQPHLHTVVLFAHPVYATISSSAVRAHLRYREWVRAVRNMVPPNVLRYLSEYRKQHLGYCD